MSEMRRPLATRRWVRRVLGAAITVLLVSGFAVTQVLRPPTEVTVEDAVQQFRTRSTDGPATTVPPGDGTASTAEGAQSGGAEGGAPAGTPSAPAAPVTAGGSTSPTPGTPATTETTAATPSQPQPGASLPQDGVYTFATEGGGETDALGGARHDYPDEVPVTVTYTECGYVVRWQPLKERWDEWEFCAEAGSRPLLRISTFHEFFRQGFRQDFDCGGADMFSHREAGQSFAWTCRSPKSTIEASVTVLGTERLDIGGMSVDAVRSRHEAVFHGDNEGSQTFEWWLAVDTGLPVKMVRSVQTKSQSPFGKVNYREDATSVATSTTPQR